MTKILVRYNEIYLKGHNRGMFERMLVQNIKKQLSGDSVNVVKVSGRVLIENYDPAYESRILKKVRKVAGVYSVSVAEVVETDFDRICSTALTFAEDGKTFRVTARRVDKTFPLNSCQLAAEVGAFILQNKPDLTVDLHNPQNQISIEVRENKSTYIYSGSLSGQGGLPVGCSGKGLVLLSGGIDSPVASYLMAKRGMTIEGLHFHSYPYTSELAKEKVLSLARIIKEYSLAMNVHVVSFTEIQDEIHRCCPEEYMVILMRRMMIRIANAVCKRNAMQAIITGENLAQVASQTVESITVTNMLAKYPVFRPLIGFDKQDIITIAERIGTFETSVQPYEDCCTVFLPDRPVIKPKAELIEKAEQKLDIDKLVENALAGMDTVII